jgi:hypothetical protein
MTTRSLDAIARDARPPRLLVHLMNPAMRIVLRTPLGRLIRPFALLEFDGRRSGCHYRIPVGWHETDSGPVVFTPARWRENFRGGGPVTVWFRGRRGEFSGALDDDPRHVAAALQSLADQLHSLRSVGIDIPPGRHITEADALAVDRALISFIAQAKSH